MAKRKRRQYDDQFRASAVVMLEAAGWPQQDGALTRVSKHLGIPHSTLRGWALGLHNPPPSNVRDEKRIDLRQAIRDELAAIFSDGDLADVRAEASYKDRMTAAAILVDKDQLLSGKPTERTEHMGEVVMQDARDKLTRKLDSYAARQDASGAADLLN